MYRDTVHLSVKNATIHNQAAGTHCASSRTAAAVLFKAKTGESFQWNLAEVKK